MKNKLPAFLLIEAVISLFLTCLAVFVISLIISCLKAINQQVKNETTNDYHLAVIQRDIYLGDEVKLQEFSPDQLKFSGVSNGNTVFLERYKNMIRVRSVNGGHMPLLTGIDQLSYQQENNETIKEKVVINGKKFETYIFFETSPAAR
ncbi:ComGF family competence protein [Xylocopilactobacillus apicola]|uniref:Competence protein ComGF n=1 Tax=Xylocopilactobacillus apicola TaxID=2932184 RepID=A0AAU9DAH9_9LACO|nr:ComGF family competence protein [Xylocopilactobacillus apicola]BDR58540.1 hypothetical protein XA3_09810 [Xylocopilactobacillus apicola]BDR58562.1 hypothetical protein XA3_10030 [Xylocopilactobacillus apicola]